MNTLFTKIAEKAAYTIGSPWAFILALLSLLIWGIAGPFVKFTDTWQLVMNTITSIITFLVVFLIQNSQNRDTKALHIKLDAIILSLNKVSNNFLGVEELDQGKIEKERKKLEIKKQTRKRKIIR